MMLRIATIALALAVIVACLREPAAAGITNAVLTTSTPSYTGACPVTIKFSGTIYGTPGTTFTYAFNRYINNVQQKPFTYIGPVPMPATGQFNVSDSMTISSTSSPSTYDQIWVLKISGGQNDVYSSGAKETPTYFSVSCPKLNPNVVNQANPSKAGLKLPQGVINQVFIAPPNGAKTTNNEQECGSHGAGFNCPIAFSNQWLVLVWCWGPNSCGPASTDQHIDKFNIYEVDGGKRVYVKSSNADQSGNLASAGFLQPPNAGFSNQCYAVTAVYGKNESVLSNPVCLGNGTIGNIDETFHASTSMTQGQSHAYNQNTFPLSSGECSPGPQCLGWYHDEGSIVAPNIIPLWYWDDTFRTYYLFDLSSIAGHYIASATLRVPVTGGPLNCFSSLAAANAYWDPNTTDFTAWIGGDFEPPGDSIGSPIDVTDIVRKWASGSPNYGFVLRGSNESFNADASRCITMLGTDATLEITHS